MGDKGRSRDTSITSLRHALPVDDFIAGLEEIVARHQPDDNQVYQAVGEGRLSLEYVKRLCKEFYWLGAAYTAEFPLLIANAPDTDALWVEASDHYFAWFQRFADATGLLGDPSHQGMKLEWASMLGISDEELLSFVPMPETIGYIHTVLWSIRRSYEEGLAAFGFASERTASRTDYAKVLYEGLKQHYGLEVRNFETQASSKGGRGIEELVREVAVTAHSQRRMRRAVLNCSVTRGARIRAMNAWLGETGARRDRR